MCFIATHLAFNQALAKQNFVCRDEQSIVARQITPYGLIQQQIIALHQQDGRGHGNRFLHYIMQRAVVGRPVQIARAQGQQGIPQALHVKGIRRALDAAHFNLLAIAHNGVGKNVILMVVKAVHAQRLHGWHAGQLCSQVG